MGLGKIVDPCLAEREIAPEHLVGARPATVLRRGVRLGRRTWAMVYRETKLIQQHLED